MDGSLTKTGVPAGILAEVEEEVPLIVLAGEESSSAEVSPPVGGETPAATSVLTPSLFVRSTTPIPRKRACQQKAAFNDFIKSQQERDKESH